LAASAVSTPLQAAISIWDGGGSDNDWSTANNWLAGLGLPQPPSDDGTADVVFNTSPRLTSNVDMTWSIRSLRFNSGSYDLTGSQLTIGSGGVTNNSTGAQEIFNNVLVPDDLTINSAAALLLFHGTIRDGRFDIRNTVVTVTGAGNTAFRDIVSGRVSITKTGTGILYLDNSNGPNTYTGQTTVLGGTLNVHLAATVPGDLTIGNDTGEAATVFTNGNDKIAHDPGDVVLVRSTGTLNIVGNETLDRLDVTGGFVSATGSLTVNGGLGLLGPGGTAGAASVFVGGDVTINGSALSSSDGAGALTIAGNVTTAPSAVTSILFGNFRTYASPAVFNVADGAAETDLEVRGRYFFGEFTKAGPGTMKLAGVQANTYDGETKVNEGVLVLAKPAGMTAVPGPLRIGDGIGGDGADVVRLEAHNQIGPTEAPDGRNRGLLIHSSGLLDLNGFNETLYSVSLIGSAITTGNGTLTLLDGFAGFSNNATPARVSGKLHFPAGPKSIRALNGPLEDDLILSAGLTIAPGALLTFAGDGQALLTGAAPVGGPAYSVAEGTLVLDKSGSDVGAPSGIDLKGAGVVRLRRPEQIGSAPGSLVKVGGTALLDLDGRNETIRDLTMSGGAVTTGTGTLAILGKVAYDASAAGTTATINANLNLAGQSPALFEIGDGPADVDMTLSGSISNGDPRKTLGGTLRLNGANTFAGSFELQAGTLALGHDQALGTGSLLVTGGTIRADSNLTVPNTLNVGGAMTIQTGATLQWTGRVFNPFGRAVQKVGPGTLTLSGDQAHAAGTVINVEAGTLRLVSDLGAGGRNVRLVVNQSAARIDIAGTQHVEALTVGAGIAVLEPATPKVLVTRTLDVDHTDARLDVGRHALVIDYTGPSPLPDVKQDIATAYANGAWSGFGITSSAAASNPTFALGFAEASQVLGLSGNQTANWLGETVDASTVLVRHTRVGDANLDGMVAFADLVALAQNYGTADGSGVWARGDFNYDAAVTFADLVMLAQNYGSAAAPPVAGLGAAFAADVESAFATVPEPTIAALGLGMAALVCQRRGRRCRQQADLRFFRNLLK
jgi:autotransporter-associated beta strand protein